MGKDINAGGLSRLDYLKYYFHNENLMVVIGIISLVPSIIGTLLAGPITKRLGIKATMLSSVIMSVLSSAAIMFVPASSASMAIFLVLRAIDGFTMGISTPAQTTMMPAAMDYTEWKTGMNVNGFMGSIQGVMKTIATAIAGALTAGHWLGLGMYQEVEGETDNLYKQHKENKPRANDKSYRIEDSVINTPYMLESAALLFRYVVKSNNNEKNLDMVNPLVVDNVKRHLVGWFERYPGGDFFHGNRAVLSLRSLDLDEINGLCRALLLATQ